MIRSRRPTSKRTRVDREATAAMHFLNRDSYVHLDGRHIYCGQDARVRYGIAHYKWVEEGRLCGRCGKYVAIGEENWEHVIPKGNHGVTRDDHPRNRAFIHGMDYRVKEDCHRAAHNREIHLRTIPHAEGATP